MNPSKRRFIKKLFSIEQPRLNHQLWALALGEPRVRLGSIDAELEKWGTLLESAWQMPVLTFTASPEFEERGWEFLRASDKNKLSPSKRGDNLRAGFIAKSSHITPR